MNTDAAVRADAIAQFGSHGSWGWFKQFSADQLVRMQELGLGAVWLGGSPKHLKSVREALDATTTLTVATGIVNIWNTDARAIGEEYLAIEADHPGRFFLGIGAGHPEANADYSSPWDSVNRYLDVLDDVGVPTHRRLLAALGPKMLQLSAQRSLGAHPYLTTSAHTKIARDLLGSDGTVFLAPENKVVLDADPVAARTIGRPPVENPYLHLRNYVSNLKRLGYTDADVADGGSDRLIDDLVAHGEAAAVRSQIDGHLDAGADHVTIQVLGSDDPTVQLAAILSA